MPMFERTIPPPMWSSFPSNRLDTRHRGSTISISPDFPNTLPTPIPIMGPNHSQPRSSRSSLINFCRGASFRKKKASSWDPPSYEESQSHPKVSSKSPRPSTESDSDSRYSFLKDFDTIFLVDDSSSMSGPRWAEAEKAISAIAPICTQNDADGIDIYFLNHRRASTASTTGVYSNITTAEDVREIFHSVHPRGSTPVGRRLLQILTPYLHRVQAMQAARTADGYLSNPALYVKPVNIITITDGEFTDDAESVIVQVARVLDSAGSGALPWQVGIQFFQIGEDERVRRYLQELDDDLGKWCRDEKVRDIVDTVPWRGRSGEVLDAEGILKCVLGAINKKYDRRVVQ
ncbi:uncharacterized protein N7473_010257 [Penicillium subrubescens]|uniref:VWFA domain-containing protein n=1 Tax=Penicillium subrubescens TaxID=1316194 RepID=A0A1Q5UD88_9EURO|nr:uncharacterized protein N7473_010257 [Penicillium subrubescens]KAJ5883371.1 hypothetical protein N7473_010257 [Penicillium subrubescens]OKP10430.1 hypothetical protein PENSUB_4154 [Penicillium subrubescens]